MVSSFSSRISFGCSSTARPLMLEAGRSTAVLGAGALARGDARGEDGLLHPLLLPCDPAELARGLSWAPKKMRLVVPSVCLTNLYTGLGDGLLVTGFEAALALRSACLSFSISFCLAASEVPAVRGGCKRV